MGWVIAGVLFQLAGAYVALRGLRKTLRQNKPTDAPESLLWAGWPAVVQTMQAVASQLMDTTGSTDEVTAQVGTAKVTATGADAVVAAENAAVRKYQVPAVLTDSGRLDWLCEEVPALSAAAASAVDRDEHHRVQLQQAATQLQQAIDVVQQNAQQYAADVRREARAAAYGGVRVQAWGIVLITVGVLLAAVPTWTTPPAVELNCAAQSAHACRQLP